MGCPSRSTRKSAPRHACSSSSARCYFGDIAQLDRRRRDRLARRDQNIIVREHRLELAIEPRVFAMRPRNFLGRHFEPGLDIGDDIRANLIAMLPVTRQMAGEELHPAKYPEHVERVLNVGIKSCAGFKDRLKSRQTFFECVANAVLDRRPSEIDGDRNPQLGEIYFRNRSVASRTLGHRVRRVSRHDRASARNFGCPRHRSRIEISK